MQWLTALVPPTTINIDEATPDNAVTSGAGPVQWTTLTPIPLANPRRALHARWDGGGGTPAAAPPKPTDHAAVHPAHHRVRTIAERRKSGAIEFMGKHLIDIDERALEMARAELGTTTIKETVNEALRRVTSARAQQVAAALDSLAATPSEDRAAAWR